MREQQERRRAVTIRWMCGAGVPQVVDEVIALHLVGHKVSVAELAGRVASDAGSHHRAL